MMRGFLTAALLVVTGCDTSGFRDAYMSLDSAGQRKRERFFTDTESIFCIAKVASGVDDVTVSASIRASQLYDPRDGRPYDVDYLVGIGDDGPGKGEDITISFELSRGDDEAPYTAGRFVCELGLDGEVKERLPFEIVFPDCPEAPIYAGGICAGFVIEGSRCDGALADRCVCGSDGYWSCE